MDRDSWTTDKATIYIPRGEKASQASRRRARNMDQRLDRAEFEQGSRENDDVEQHVCHMLLSIDAILI